MFYLSRNTELTTELLNKIIAEFNNSIKPKLNRYKRYYDGLQDILNKKYIDASKPCNKTVINYCRNIVDSYTGYLATPSFISYSSANDIEEIMDILRYNDYQAEDCDYLQDALIYGYAAELMYIDNESKTRFRLINPMQCFGIYDDSLTADLLYFVRIYKECEWSNSNKYLVDVYTDNEIRHYTMQGADASFLTAIGAEPHYFSQCPANIFYMPNEESIFDCVITLQDAVNQLLSAEIDDYSAFCDALLALIGVDAEADDISAMKQSRVLLLPTGATAQWITKNSSDAQVENILKRLHDSIYRIAQCPDFSSETFVGGVSSGIAIRYRLCGMENKAGIIEGRMKKALQRRVEIICGIATLKYGEEIYRDIQIDFKRNIPEDLTSTINTINSLKGIVSDSTLLAQLPFVEDVNAELEAVQEQKAANMELYGFTAPTAEETEE